jgi:hypothetical protein
MANQPQNQSEPKRGTASVDLDKKKEIAKKAGESIPLKKQPQPASRKIGETRQR